MTCRGWQCDCHELRIVGTAAGHPTCACGHTAGTHKEKR